MGLLKCQNYYIQYYIVVEKYESMYITLVLYFFYVSYVYMYMLLQYFTIDRHEEIRYVRKRVFTLIAQ